MRSPEQPRPDASRCRLLVRLHGEVLGYLHLDFIPEADDPRVLDESWRLWGGSIRHHLRADGVTVAERAPIPPRTDRCVSGVRARERVSVVVCTRDRPDEVARCVAALTRLTYPLLEIVVVDNAPRDERTRRVVESAARDDARIRYVVEPRPGLSRARNRGLAAATGELIAYTDDDVIVDEQWVDGLVRAFRRGSDVGCVTGLVCTAQITNRYERFFDVRTASWSNRVTARRYPPAEDRRADPLYPYSAGQFGTGANFAFRRELLTTLGGFDELLGAGTRCRGGEDLDAFVRVVRSGHSIGYEPSALVWHRHRADFDALRTQMYAYGVGLAAYLAKICGQPGVGRDLIARVPAGLTHLARLHLSRTREAELRSPRGARRAELVGYLFGAFHYVISVLAARRAGPS